MRSPRPARPRADAARTEWTRRDAGLLTLAGLAGAAGAAGGLGALLAAPGAAQAQQALVPGRDFIVLKHPLPPPENGRVDVIDFFWYGCPHCFAFESVLAPWAAQLPSAVRLVRVPYGFDEALREEHQRIFYTLEAVGQAQAMHAKVFESFHTKRQAINTGEQMSAFARENGLDVAKVDAAWNSFYVQTRMRQAKALCADYQVDFVPVIGVQGRYLVNPAVDHDGPRALVVTDSLINLVRQGG